MAASGAIRIGTSGYQYDHWLGPFYPNDLPRRCWLGFYASRFDAVEINNTFYRLPKPETLARWRRDVPAGFLFTLKLSRYATHMKRLRDPEASLSRFLEVVRYLGDALGAVLVQLPPQWRANPERLDAFLEAAPREQRWAVEFRDPSWLNDEVFSVLAAHGTALCVHDMLPGHPWRVTADWVYLRFHGGPYGGSYGDEELRGTAEWLAGQSRAGRGGFVFFNNDQGGHAPRNALRLAEMLREEDHGDS